MNFIWKALLRSIQIIIYLCLFGVICSEWYMFRLVSWWNTQNHAFKQNISFSYKLYDNLKEPSNSMLNFDHKHDLYSETLKSKAIGYWSFCKLTH